MSPQPNREVALFSAALELPADQRSAYLVKSCADDPALRQRLEVLLGEHEKAISFLEAPPVGGQGSLSGAAAPEALAAPSGPAVEKAGGRIGRYKLLQQIGEGGCGVVYMAEQMEPVRRQVALKVIKLGMDTKQVIARFEAERQALALMEHPNIAKVFDAGATETGRPYFVMELVRGIKITDYCDQHNLSTQERLNLFMQVCEAIQHAHQKGVIHRDIKPSNILVTVSKPGGPGCPKIIDFGIAKATTGQHLTDKTVFTAFEQFIGTPAYMSPEQAMMTALDIDTRTDIYSLGVLLYELLTGKTPFDTKELLAAGLDAMRQTIREVEPLKPSTRLTKDRLAKLSGASDNSKIENLKSQIDNDLDWIVMKALEKDRERRYITANGLARDVQRYLTNEPVTARPPGKLYRFQKLVRRNKLAFAAAGAVAAALILGMATALWEFLKEREARQQAVAAESRAQAINRFLTEGLLLQATPEQNSREKKVTMEDVLARATALLDKDAEIARQPELEATLRLDFGITFVKLSVLAEAERNLRLAYNLRHSQLGPQNTNTLTAEHELAGFLITRLGRFEEAEPLIREAWEGRQHLLGATNGDTLDSQQGCMIILEQQGRLEEANQLGRQNLLNCEQALGSDHTLTLDSFRNLSGVVSQLGDHAQAEQLVRQGLIRSRRARNREQELWFVNQIAFQRLLQGDPEEADKWLADAVPQAILEFGADSSIVLWTQRIWARALADEGQLGKAEALAKSTLKYKRLTADKLGASRTLLILGRVLVEERKLDEAEPLLQEALTFFCENPIGRRQSLGAQGSNWLGAIKAAHNVFPEAETLLLPSSDQFFAPGAEMSPNERRLAVGHIIAFYQALKNPDQVAFWQKRLDSLPQPKVGHQ